MKLLLRKKWFRITTSIVLVVAILTSIAVVIANRRGAEELQHELAEARAAGMLLTRAELDADLRPPERNAALHGILKEWEDAVARPAAPGAEEVLATFKPFAKPKWYEAWEKPDKPRDHLNYRDRKLAKDAPQLPGPPVPDQPAGSAHFWLLSKSDGYGQDPVSFLAEFERRHGAVLRRLQHDLTALPECRRPLAEASPLAGDLTYDRLARRCYRIHEGLALHAEAALQAGQPGLAADSITLGLKLGSALGSRGPDGSQAMQTSLRSAMRPLRNGITRHQWRPQDLDRIAATLQAMDLRRATQRDVAASVLMVPQWELWKKDRHAFRNQGGSDFEFSEFRAIEHEFVRGGAGYLAPGGWFDWNAAELLHTIRACHALAQAPGPLLPWWTEGQRLQDTYYPGGKSNPEKKRWLLLAYPHATGALQTGARASVMRDQTLAACALQKHYGEHRTYPATLPPGVPQDPLLGISFGYKLKPEGGFALYSLGPNGKDDGGKRSDGGKGDDWGW